MIPLACGRNGELWEQPFQACAIDADCVKLDGQNSVISFVIFKMFAPRALVFLTTGQGERRLWERDCLRMWFQLCIHEQNIICSKTHLDDTTL